MIFSAVLSTIHCRVVRFVIFKPGSDSDAQDALNSCSVECNAGGFDVEFGAFEVLHRGTVIVPQRVVPPCSPTAVSFVLSTFRNRLLAPRQAVSCCTSSLYADVSFLLMRIYVQYAKKKKLNISSIYS